MTKRIQRKRTKGWRMPAGAVYVGRPTKWGNPFVKMLAPWPRDTPAMLVTWFAWQITLWRVHEPAAFEKWIAPLRGKDLACWCPPGTPCHADVLSRLARQMPESGRKGHEKAHARGQRQR